MLGLLWPDIREMLLTEMNFEEKYVRESVTEQIAKLKVRYGKNNIKRVIPGKSPWAMNHGRILFILG